MTESRFVAQNKAAWDTYESMVEAGQLYDPSELGEAYLALSTDLAFAQSHYPDSPVCRYLNALTLQYHHELYRRHPQRWKELWHFFSHDVVLTFYTCRRYLLFTAVILLLGCVLGTLSQVLDDGFFVSFFGVGYYNTTMENIQSGNPMGIYASEDEVEMFFDIWINNVLVSLIFFINGLLSPFYVIFKTMQTGVMMGCFDAFFAQNNHLADAIVASNEHGALEIPACIVCCAGGLRLGFGWFFPGTRTRLQALRESAIQGLMMFLAMVPVLTVAAFIESFITRHQEWPMAMRVGLVMMGLMFIAYYCILLPRKLARKEGMI